MTIEYILEVYERRIYRVIDIMPYCLSQREYRQKLKRIRSDIFSGRVSHEVTEDYYG